MFSKILIANRGEIACRIIRTCRTLGIQTVAVCSEADKNALFVRMADEAVPIGGAKPADSYLVGERIIEAAKSTGAQAIHPGYGFLSENAAFVEAVEAAGLTFIGPSADSMRRMGSKAGAKKLMRDADVPVVPGYEGDNQDPDFLAEQAEQVGYPLMIKAAHGGGGKGMRIVREAAAFAENLASCQREAKNAFGNDRVLLERYIESPRHIEFQIFGDSQGRVVHLNERECSAQRRHQKVLEEAPSPFLTPELRTQMGEAAIKAGAAIGYRNAGTVEFIVAPNGEFFFLEINTRLQVEHPVTEMTLGVDLVAWQLRVAAGEPLPTDAGTHAAQGHAIEVRLYAEDPAKNFLPGSGTISELTFPAEPWQVPPGDVRVDAGVTQGDTVTIFYDPMIAKLIVHAPDRASALAKLDDALWRTHIHGTSDNIAFLSRLIHHPAVVQGRIDTGYLDRHLDEFLPTNEAPQPHLSAAAIVLDALAACDNTQPGTPFGQRDDWRVSMPVRRHQRLQYGEHTIEASSQHRGDAWDIHLGEEQIALTNVQCHDGHLSFDWNGQRRRLAYRSNARAITLRINGQPMRFTRLPMFDVGDASAGNADAVIAPMPGRIVAVNVAVGDEVKQDDVLLIMEAMKMELSLRAPRDGVIEEIRTQVDAFMDADAVLVKLAKT